MIYLVEDDANIRELVTYALNNMGLEAESFSTPKEFWQGISKKTPSLVLLDIMLPEENGIDILKKLRDKLVFQARIRVSHRFFTNIKSVNHKTTSK